MHGRQLLRIVLTLLPAIVRVRRRLNVHAKRLKPPNTKSQIEGCSVGIVESRAISPRLSNPQHHEILDPDNSEVISQTHLSDDKPKPEFQSDETSLVQFIYFTYSQNIQQFYNTF